MNSLQNTGGHVNAAKAVHLVYSLDVRYGSYDMACQQECAEIAG